MAATLSKLEGRVTLASDASITVTENAGAPVGVLVAAAGNYYLTELLTAIAAALTADATLAGTYTLTADDDADTSTGKVTIAASGGGVTTIAVTWTSTELRDALGFTGDVSGAASHQGAASSPYLFLPNCGRIDPWAEDGDDGIDVSDGTLVVAPGGESVAVSGPARYEDNLQFPLLKGYKVFESNEAVPNESLQTFWRNVMRPGRPFRYHRLRDIDGTYNTWKVDQEGMQRFAPVRVEKTWGGAQALYTWRSRVLKVV